MSGIPGQWGRGGLREQFIGQTPSDLERQLTDPNFHVRDFPRDSQDKQPTTYPLPDVARATTRSHAYEHFMLSKDFDGNGRGNNASGPALMPGDFHVFRATFAPDHWEIYKFMHPGTAYSPTDIFFCAVGQEAIVTPYDVIPNEQAPRCATIELPGRGMSLVIWAASNNTQPGCFVVKAVASLASTIVGAIDE